MSNPRTTVRPARLIAEMIEARAWSIPDDCADHPILGPAIALRQRIYAEKRSRDFTEARLAADEAAIEHILEACK